MPPKSLYARATSRGFPVFDTAGQSGQGALQDSTLPRGAAAAAAGNPPSPSWANPNNDPGSVPAQLPPPEAYALLGGVLWGLPGAPNPDDTPRTHAAPFADPAQLAAGDDDGTHGPVFTGVAVRHTPGAVTAMAESRTGGQGSSADTLQPLHGQIRVMGGRDAVQGYGGGGPGPGGVNIPQGPATDQQAFGGYTYHNLPVNAAEVPFLVPDSGQFIASAPELPSYMPVYDGPTASVLAQASASPDLPAQGPAITGPQPGLPAYAASFWG